MPPKIYKRAAAVAILVVGEGASEVTALQHLKRLYLPRDCGISAMIRDAGGKGGAQVLDYAIAYRNGNRGFARTIALLDTDTDWSQAHRARARRERITVVESQPCLEAVLLDVVGRAGERTTEEHKRLFRQVFGHPAHEPAIYDKYFCAEVLEEAKARVDTMRALLRALTGKEH